MGLVVSGLSTFYTWVITSDSFKGYRVEEVPKEVVIEILEIRSETEVNSLSTYNPKSIKKDKPYIKKNKEKKKIGPLCKRRKAEG